MIIVLYYFLFIYFYFILFIYIIIVLYYCIIGATHTHTVNQHINYLQTLLLVMRRKVGRSPWLYRPSGGQRMKKPGRTEMILKETPFVK